MSALLSELLARIVAWVVERGFVFLIAYGQRQAMHKQRAASA